MTPPTKAHQLEPAACVGKFDAYAIVEGSLAVPKNFFAEEKKDDLRYLLQIAPNGAKKNYLTSRRISKETGNYVEKQDWCPMVRDHEFFRSADTILDGGWHGEGISSDVVHQMRQGKGSYCAFDIIRYRGRDLTGLVQVERTKLMMEVVRQLDVKWLTYNSLIPSWKIRAALKTTLEAGKEGLVLKDSNALYGKGWYKAKRKETFDVFITGYGEPDSEIYAKKGWIGQLRIGQLLPGGKTIELGYVKNMTDSLRVEISRDRDNFLDAVVEISAQERMKSGKFRNPSVVQLRPDKDYKLCRYNPSVEA